MLRINRIIDSDYLHEEGVSQENHIPIWLEFGKGYHRDGGKSVNTGCGLWLMTCFIPGSKRRRNIYILDKSSKKGVHDYNMMIGVFKGERKTIENCSVHDYERNGYEVHVADYCKK